MSSGEPKFLLLKSLKQPSFQDFLTVLCCIVALTVKEETANTQEPIFVASVLASNLAESPNVYSPTTPQRVFLKVLADQGSTIVQELKDIYMVSLIGNFDLFRGRCKWMSMYVDKLFDLTRHLRRRIPSMRDLNGFTKDAAD
ncbi:hypothetical protein IL306_003890 [Fusarium sp. DS 682]|nr:hypothetical protein IL306_003890 [Fusarium sp. DS 682]